MRNAQHLDTDGAAGGKPAAGSAAFRELMGQFVTGVCVIAIPGVAPGDEDRGASTGVFGNTPMGMTVNSFASVSLEPMLISWAIQNNASRYQLFADALDFTVSILAEDQQPIARRYTGRGNSQRQVTDFEFSDRGLPVIANALGYLECRRWSLNPAGDHTIILGEVNTIRLGSPKGPLGFFGGGFCRIAD